jgi:hypothetical protein
MDGLKLALPIDPAMWPHLLHAELRIYWRPVIFSDAFDPLLLTFAGCKAASLQVFPKIVLSSQKQGNETL